jgi:hypothetical protein
VFGLAIAVTSLVLLAKDAPVSPTAPAAEVPSAPPGPLTTPAAPAPQEEEDEPQLVLTPTAKKKARPAPGPAAPVEPAAPAHGVSRLTLGAEPFALVRIDGRDHGSTPLTLDVAAGVHKVEWVSPDTQQVRMVRELNLEPGEHQRIIAR